jgi:DNA repair exonuclease SbcCD ATPase subunit
MFSHNDLNEKEELKQLKEEIEAIKQKNKELENNITSLKQKNKELEDSNNKLKKNVNDKEMDLAKCKQLQTKTAQKHAEVQDINDVLIEDIRALNDRLLVFVPGAIEKENTELRETLGVLHAVIDIYKQAEIDAEVEESEVVKGMDDAYNDRTLDVFTCETCEYKSETQRGLNVHIGKKHNKKYPGGNFNLISL